MKPGRKISLTYSVVTILLIAGACLVFLLGSGRYTTTLYYHYLEEKARVLAMERYGQDDMDPVKYRNVVQRRKNAIPTSHELFVATANADSARAELGAYLSAEQLAALFRGEVVNFRHGNEVGTALLYYDNSGTFASVVLSRNPYGEELYRTLTLSLVVLIVAASVLLWLISRLWAGRMVNRIDKNYQTERLFVNNARHEINNPLTAIRGECEVALLRERSPEEYRASLQHIEEQTEHIETIMTQLLSLSNARNHLSNMQKVNLQQWFAQAALPPHTLLVRHNFSVDMDPEALLIAMQNLIGNAVKYGDGGAVQVVIDKPLLCVTNHGTPIPQTELPHIFDPFYRAANAATVAGHGIGLSLCATLLQRAGAHISATSSAQEGTSFTIRF